MAGFNANIWAPWRMEYIRSLEAEAGEVGCFLCHYWQNPQDDRANHVVLRGKRAFAVMNRFPYTNGHLLIAPVTHNGTLAGLDEATLMELTTMTRDAVGLLEEALSPQGFNIGYNIGRCAGAGLPDHLHGHVVPRWNADTNYMAVLGGIRVVPDALNATHEQLVQTANRLGLLNRESG